jgi:hypothetical protein
MRTASRSNKYPSEPRIVASTRHAYVWLGHQLSGGGRRANMGAKAGQERYYGCFWATAFAEQEDHTPPHV